MEQSLPKPIQLDERELNWLKENHEQTTYAYMAERIGVCVDTLKRILVRVGLQEFDGAKYQLKRDTDTLMWSRPCLDCLDETPRPKMWFYCRSCRKKRGFDDDG
tara:strand:- start:3005 stop:3316 length:312 start_codon:yes stop_codon:yes gene_type:complete